MQVTVQGKLPKSKYSVIIVAVLALTMLAHWRNGELLGLMAVGNQPTHHIDQAVDWTAVTRMFNLRNVLQLVNHRLNNRPFPQQQAIRLLTEVIDVAEEFF
jgi:hypothetical protein